MFTMGTFIGFLPCMKSYMLLQTARLSKSFWTMRTGVGLLSSVTNQMSSQSMWLREWLFTLRAAIGFLFQMHLQMEPQCRCTWKRLGALVARKGFVSWVSSHVVLQIPHWGKRFRTLFTNILFMIRVNFLMVMQGLSWIVWFSTLRAEKGSESSMHSQMTVKPVGFWKNLGTLITSEDLLSSCLSPCPKIHKNNSLLCANYNNKKSSWKKQLDQKLYISSLLSISKKASRPLEI